MMATNVLLSGNNYYKVSHLFKYMNMGFVGKDLFFNIQDTYCVGTIREFWEVKRSTAIQRLQDKDSVVVLGMSPGFLKIIPFQTIFLCVISLIHDLVQICCFIYVFLKYNFILIF